MHAPSFVEFKSQDIEQSIAARLEQQAQLWPARRAVKTRRVDYTYAEFNRAANRLAHAIVAARGPAGEPVLLLVQDSATAILSMFAALKANKVYAPVETSLPTGQLQQIAADLQAHLIVCDQATAGQAAEFARAGLQVLNADALEANLPTENLGLPILPEAHSCILYTSGSTGQPKGVLRDQRMFLHGVRLKTNNSRLSAADRTLLLQSPSFSAGAKEVFATLLNGAALHILNLREEGLANFSDLMRQEEITNFMAAPSLFRQMVATLDEQRAPWFPQLRLINLGSETILQQDVELLKYFADDCQLQLALGSTETQMYASYLIDKHTAMSRRTISGGYVQPDYQVRVVDETGHEMGFDQVGEIVVSSRFLALGYWGQPELTAQVFSTLPTGERNYHTGDLGRLQPDGFLEHLGRQDTQVKIRGIRVETGQVEMALLDHPHVAEAAVVGRRNPSGETYLAAYVVPRRGQSVSPRELRGGLKSKLPDSMVPSAFVTLDALPRNANGKLDRAALPDPALTRPRRSADYVPPGDELSEALVHLWEQALDLHPIGIRDDFFDLGGHSLLAARLVADLEKNTGRKLPVRLLYEAPTIEKLAALLRVENPTWSALVPLQPHGSKPPLYYIPPYNAVFAFRSLAAYLGPDQPVYAVPAAPEGDHNPFTSIKDQAAYSVQQIRAFQPEGPYYLSGWSYGGQVAFEIAQQLFSQGQKVAFLGIIDIGFTPTDVPSRLSYLGRRVRYVWKRGLRAQVQQVRARAKRLAAAHRQGLDPERQQELADLARSRRYKPKGYAGPITFFRIPPDDHTLLFRDPQWGWDRLARGALEVEDIPGNHNTLVLEPHVRVLANKIQASLLKARQPSS